MSYLFLFVQALFLTIFIECSVVLILHKFTGKFFDFDTHTARLLGIVALATAFTLPYVWFIGPQLIQDRTLFGISAELFAFIMESVWYFFALKISTKKALTVSFAANLASFIVGLFVF